MSDISAGTNVGARPPVPGSVLGARSLLWLQASIWGVLALSASIGWMAYVLAAHGPPQVRGVLLGGLAMALLDGFAVGSLCLAMSLKPGRNAARRMVMGLEAFMTCFGLFLTCAFLAVYDGIVSDMPILAGFIGGALSLTALVGLSCGPARRFAQMSAG